MANLHVTHILSCEGEVVKLNHKVSGSLQNLPKTDEASEIQSPS